MSISNIPVYVCDRCGTREEIRRSEFIYPWGKIIFSEANGPKWVGGQMAHAELVKHGKDICPTCLGEVFDWWKSKKP